jgi:hypothetical protein
MKRNPTHPLRISTLVTCGILAIAGGCRSNTVDKSAFKSALNDYYSTRHDCVWTAPVKFPVQVDASKDDQTKGFDALTDAGLLTRLSAEKKRFLIGSKQVTDYDLSDKGRMAWTADPTQPGYGNFCFGHREVTTVDSFSPADNPDASQYSVSYHYDVTALPDWASSMEMKTAFPKIASETSGQQTATATLVKSEKGWQVSAPEPAADTTVLPQ